MTVYLDTSVILSRFLGQSNALRAWGEWDKAYVSVLSRVEFHRTMDRLRLEGTISDGERRVLHTHFHALWQATHRVPLSVSILDRAAEPFPTVVGTLDALHLASALAVARLLRKDALVLLTHDEQLGQAAAAEGLQVYGVRDRCR
jgi:predicted nucleic acid-binding protein